MQIRNAAYNRQLDLLDCRTAMLGLDFYAIESDNTFEQLKRRCFNCDFQEACEVDLRRDPNSLVWESYCPNAAALWELAEAQAHIADVTAMSAALSAEQRSMSLSGAKRT